MNNVESTKGSLVELCREIEEHGDYLNKLLDYFKVSHIDISHALTTIEKQIKSAESKFTIAFVGTFKTGKSTIINSLLGLKGDARLSSEYDPDTAKSIRLIYADGVYANDGEAVVDFGDFYPEEKMSWRDAKRYTSQVALDLADDEFRQKASHIDEVRYYVSSPLLRLCNILDLPGTGTGGHSEHTEVTNQKILESDCFFWVVSTSSEPDIETVKNLQKIKHKLLPIINVWQKECDDIYSDITPEEIITTIQENYSAYLANADEPVIYYAGEIDNAQQNGEEIKPEWGKVQFTEKVESILQNIQTGDRASRIESNLFSAIDECRQVLDHLEDDAALVAVCKIVASEKSDIEKTDKKLRQRRLIASSDVQNEANKTANEIVDILADASESFINEKMDGLNFKALFKGKKKYSDELLKEYSDNYIRLKDGWVEDLGNNFVDNVQILMDGIFVDFEWDMDNVHEIDNVDSDKLNIGNFTQSIAAGIQKDMADKLIPVLLEIVVGITLMFIPGLNLLDSVYMIAAAVGSTKGLANNDKLQQKAKGAVLRTRVQIRQQKHTIVGELKKIGIEVVNQYYTTIKNELESRGIILDTQKEQYNNIITEIATFKEELDEQEKIVKELFKG